MDEHGFELWGLPWADEGPFEDLSAHIHPADRDRVRAAFVATRSVAGSYEIDFRMIVGDEIRWISARGQGADAGIVGPAHVRDLPRRHRPQAGGGRPRTSRRRDEPPRQEPAGDRLGTDDDDVAFGGDDDGDGAGADAAAGRARPRA